MVIVKLGDCVTIKRYAKLSDLSKVTNIVGTLNAWKEGCGDKLIQYGDFILLHVEGVSDADLDGDIGNGYFGVNNSVIISQDGNIRSTVLNTQTDSSRFRLNDYDTTSLALMVGAASVIPSKGFVTLDDFIDELIVQEK